MQIGFNSAFKWLMRLEFSRHILKNPQIPNFMKILSMGVVLIHVDRQRDMATLIVSLCNFVNAPKTAPAPTFLWNSRA